MTLKLSVPKIRNFAWRGNFVSLPFTENLACLESTPTFASSASSILTSQNLIRFYGAHHYVKSRGLYDSTHYKVSN